ncbi:MAG: tRNA-specific adenosine deaminase [Bacteroidetes bacterium HGW-Bacteroidetes-1]|nr:MAG: tRNA-specific adenosine deaminase [Bacteroidetes bacterium HGW-Bacteroidetes-1]
MIKRQKLTFMREAIALANNNLQTLRGGPFGAVIVKDGKIIGRGSNAVTSENDPTAHAEIMAIRDACKNLGSFQLDDCEIYSSCEPCPMCLGAIYWARPSKLYFAASREDAAIAGFDDSYIYQQIPLEPLKRDLISEQIMSVEAKQVFSKWVAMDQKTPY